MSIILYEGFPAGCMLIFTQAQSLLTVKSDICSSFKFSGFNLPFFL